MLDKEKISKELEELSDDELKKKIRELLDKKGLPEENVYLLKILIIKDLIRRKKLEVLLDYPPGEPYETSIETLKIQDMNLILRQYLFHSISLRCIIKDKEVIFSHIEGTT